MPALTHRDLEGKVAVVTGSSSGIGRATALELGRRGAALVLHGYRNMDGLQLTARQLMMQRVETRIIATDVSQADGCERLIQAAYAWQNRVDIWINNAGADVLTGPISKQSFVEKLERLWNVDVKATILLGRAVGERMYFQTPNDSRPVIINIGWDQAQDGIEGEAGMLFGPTKSAVMAFSQALAQHLTPKVRVNCVAPGWIRTKWGEGTSEYWDMRAKTESLSNRWGDANDVATSIGFLASPAADFVNAVIMPVNGGQRCYAHSKPYSGVTSHSGSSPFNAAAGH
jgi:3-oxoacyl-[acyl-carrier protein] reductase